MSDDPLAQLLRRNADHVRSLLVDHFDLVQEGQEPVVVSVCCSDSRVPQEGMFDVEEPGWLFSSAVLGNQAWDVVEDERVVEGSLLFPLVTASTRVAAVVGHTQCGAITAAYDRVQGNDTEHAPGIEKWVDLLEPVVEAGLESDLVDDDADRGRVVDQLVEYNVRRQVQFLGDAPEVPDDVGVVGFVYDFTGRYEGERGRTYLVSVDGETDTSVLRDRVPEDCTDAVRTLLST